MKEKKTSFGTWNRFGIIVVLFCLFFAPFVQAQQSWHLSGDWSDESNPNGPWSYNKMPGVPIVANQSDWDSLDVIFTTAQPAWAEAQLPATGHVPAWFKVVSDTDPEIDLPVGVVGMHGSETSTAGVIWTSPIAGQVEINGAVWLARHSFGRSMTWSLFHNGGDPITGGMLTSSDANGSENPFTFSAAFGEPIVRTVAIGDTIELDLAKISEFAEFVGVSMWVSEILPDMTDHYLSYVIKRPRGEPKFEKFEVLLEDQFQATVFTVKKRVALYNPVDKNGEGILDPETHLVGYEIKRPKGVPKPPKEPIIGIKIKDQFFDELIVDIKDVNKADRLLVPASKSLSEVPAPLDPVNEDHFLCYRVKLPKETEFPKDIQVTLTDQFIDPDSELFDLKRPRRLCNPVDKNGEGTKNPENHLICYDVKRSEGAPKHEGTVVFLNDQFGEVENWEAKREKELCVPAEKTLP